MTGEWYVRGNGWLHRLDPRVKFFMAIAMIVLCCMWGNPIFLAALLVVIHLMLVVDRTPARAVGHVWRYLLPIEIIVAIIWLLADHSGADVLWQWNGIRISVQSLITTGIVALRIADIVWAIFLVLLTTSQAAWVNGLAKLGLPFHAAITWARIIRFVPTFAAINDEILRKKRARGLTSRFGAHIHAWHATRERISWRADQITIGMRIRGSHMDRRGVPRTYYADVHMRAGDWITLVLTVLVIAGVIVMKYFGW